MMEMPLGYGAERNSINEECQGFTIET